MLVYKNNDEPYLAFKGGLIDYGRFGHHKNLVGIAGVGNYMCHYVGEMSKSAKAAPTHT